MEWHGMLHLTAHKWNNFQTKHIYDSYITINMVLALVLMVNSY